MFWFEFLFFCLKYGVNYVFMFGLSEVYEGFGIL